MDLSRLPLAVVEEIERFVQPWRTYKKEEADLITWHCMWLEDEIREKNLHFEDGLVLRGLVRVDRLGSVDGLVRLDRLGSAPEDDLGHQVRLGDSLVRLSRLASEDGVGHQVRLGDGYRYVRGLGHGSE